MKKFLLKLISLPKKLIPSFSLKIRSKLIFAFGVPMLLTIGLVAAGIWQLQRANELNDDIVTKRWARLQVSNQAILIGKDMTIGLYEMLLTKTKEDLEKEIANSDRDKEKEADVFKRISEDSYTETGAALVNEIAALRDRFLNSRLEFIENLKAGKRDQASKDLNDKVRPLKDQYVKELEGLKEYEASRMGEDNAVASQEYKLMHDASIGVASGIVIASILLLWLVTRAIVRPISRAAQIAESIAKGKFDNEIKVTSNDETGALLSAMKTMQEQMGALVDNLQKTGSMMRRGVANITEISESINTASREIAAGNSDLSSRTEEQAASLEETSASMQNLAATVKSNEKTAQSANELARNAATVAITGQENMEKVAGSISKIEEATRKITNIVDTVKEIASDTNLLSFNAAIEAERAGEAGRGFGVVAAEVRELSKKSRAAVIEIQQLVGDVLGKIKEGTNLTNDASKVIGELREASQRVSDFMQEISQASSEQSVGIEQVGRALSQMEQVTQQNSALVEEASATASSLQDMAGQLVVEVGNFKMTDSAEAEVADAPTPATAGNDPVVAEPAAEVAPAPVVVAAADIPVLPKAPAGNSSDVWERH